MSQLHTYAIMSSKAGDKMKDLICKYRRDLHRIPELDHCLPKTSQYIEKQISLYTCEITHPTSTSIAAYFDFQQNDTYAFRADMDALPIQEENNVTYASKHPGCMHACGHDGHMAMVLGFAHYVNSLRSAPHNVLLIFQPAEETTGGAYDIIQSGIFEKYHTTAIFGMHMWPNLPAGKIATRPGPLMARSSEVTIEIQGVSAHAAKYEEGKDALAAAVAFLHQAYEIEKRIVSNIPRLLKFGKMESGTVRNAISNHTTILGTLRTYDDATYNLLREQLQACAQQIENDSGCTIQIHFSKGYPPLINTTSIYNQIQPFFPNLHVLDKPSLLAEDFSFYLEKIPGLFLYLGTGNDIPLHSSNFDFDEEVLVQGVEAYKILLMKTNINNT